MRVSNTSYVEILERFRRVVVGKFHKDIGNLDETFYQEDNKKFKYFNENINNMRLGDPTTCFISLSLMNKIVTNHRFFNIFLFVDYDSASNLIVM